jgi:acyl carrier protein
MSDQLSMDGLAAKVMAVIAKTQRIPPETLSIDSSFEELKIDSLDGINIIFALESEFDVNIPDEGVNNFKTVRQVVEGVHKLLLEKQSGTPETGAA